jgi:endoglucanase
MDYAVNITAAGAYTVNFRVATMFTGPQFQLRNSSGGVLATINVPNTGSFQSWQTVSAQVNLPAGQQTLRIYTSNAAGGWNINWWEIVGGQSAPPPSSSTKIEAEHYTAMQGIQKEGCADAGGGENVGWQDTGDWMDYAINVNSAATYTMNFRVASMFTGAQFQVRNSSGQVLATVTVPNTGSFQSWQTVSAQVALATGAQTIRIHTSNANGGWNLNWFEITSGGNATSSARLVEGNLTADASETLQSHEIAVFPNPVHDRFTLTADNEHTGTIKVEMISISGTVVRNFQLQKTTAGTIRFYLSAGNVPKGTYIIRASMQNWSSSTQIVKE